MKKNNKKFKSLVLLGVLGLVSCLGVFNMIKANADTAQINVTQKDTNSAVSENNTSYWLTSEQKKRAEALTSVFENSTPEIDYEYAEDLGDGRGITSGRAGFCTGTGDAIEVVKRYTDLNHSNILAKYLPELTRLENERIRTDNDQGDVSGLYKIGDYVSDWAAASKKLEFRNIQDSVVDDYYYKPSAQKADTLGLKLPLSRAQLYDAIIQHGDGNDPDSINALIERTNKKSGGNPASNKVDEKKWLRNFLAEEELPYYIAIKKKVEKNGQNHMEG